MIGDHSIDRRRLLVISAATCATGLLGSPGASRALAAAAARELTVGSRVIEVMGRAATVFGISDSAGSSGLDLYQSDGFSVRLRNATAEPTLVHWHGLTPPFAYDGNPLSQAPLAPGGSAEYGFELKTAGTHWMHSHLGLQEQLLLAAALIVRSDAERAIDRQDVVMLVHDFTFTPPEEILAQLVAGVGGHIGSGSAAMDMGMVRATTGGTEHSGMAGTETAPMPGMDHGSTGGRGGMSGMDHGAMSMGDDMAMDLNDVTFDAFLTNDRDLSDPQIVAVERGGRVRLRVINAASASNFWVNLGQVSGRLVAVDGRAVQPIAGRRFEIAMAQRLDIEIDLPAALPALPILAQREGDRARTGLILVTPGASIAKLGAEAEITAPAVLLDLERKLVAAEPLAGRSADRTIATALTGSMQGYAWGIDGRRFEDRAPIDVRQGERVEITFVNQTMMSHPMHLHGHHFQVVGVGGLRLNGAMRDTVLVPAMERITVAFDADNPGDWPLHCHNLYHMAAGMMTSVRYV